MPGRERIEQPTRGKDGERLVGSAGGIPGISRLDLLIGEGHARAGIDEYGHPRWGNEFMFCPSFEIKIGRHEGSHGANPQHRQQNRNAAREFGGIATDHPRGKRHQPGHDAHEGRHLPPLRKPFQETTGDPMLHRFGHGQQARRWEN